MAWKLAYVLRGIASPSLLQSYTIERQPAAGQIVQQAFSRLVARVLPDKSIPSDEERPDDVCELGYRYTNGAFVYDKDKSRGENWEDPRHPSALPGARMPHIVLKNSSGDDSSYSTLDLVKKNFVLLTANPSSPWIKAASTQKINIDAYAISQSSSPFYDPNGRFKAVYRLSDEGAVLIRPDGLIAWRSPSVTSGPYSKAFAEALDTILHK